MDTQFLNINLVDPEEEKLKEVVKVLSCGGLIVLPTETVYGIGFDLDSKVAMGKITDIKRERKDKQYSIAIPDLSWIENYHIEKTYLKKIDIMKDLLPGPLTFILEVDGNNKLGFRIPDNKITRNVITSFKKPIYLTSANISGNAPALNLQEAVERLKGKVDLIIDGGSSFLYESSLVLDLTQNPVKILREGPPLFAEEIRRRFKIR